MAVSGAAGPDSRLEVFVLPGIGEIRAGVDLAAVVLASAGPAAGLLALVAPSGGEPNECAPLLQQMKEGKAPKTVKG